MATVGTAGYMMPLGLTTTFNSSGKSNHLHIILIMFNYLLADVIINITHHLITLMKPVSIKGTLQITSKNLDTHISHLLSLKVQNGGSTSPQ